MGYTKLFLSIITSTIWSEDDRTRIVWITMLASADKNGEVQASIPGLARLAGVPVESCRSAIKKFLEPDRDSRTKDDEGRRIEEIDGGWHLINHRKYREMACDEDRRNQAAIRQQRAREKKSRNSHAGITNESRQIPQAEAEAYPLSSLPRARGGDWPELREVIEAGESTTAPAGCAAAFYNEMEGCGWVNKHGHPVADWRALLRNWTTKWKANEQRAKNHERSSTHQRRDSGDLNKTGRYGGK